MQTVCLGCNLGCRFGCVFDTIAVAIFDRATAAAAAAAAASGHALGFAALCRNVSTSVIIGAQCSVSSTLIGRGQHSESQQSPPLLIFVILTDLDLFAIGGAGCCYCRNTRAAVKGVNVDVVDLQQPLIYTLQIAWRGKIKVTIVVQ